MSDSVQTGMLVWQEESSFRQASACRTKSYHRRNKQTRANSLVQAPSKQAQASASAHQASKQACARAKQANKLVREPSKQTSLCASQASKQPNMQKSITGFYSKGAGGETDPIEFVPDEGNLRFLGDEKKTLHSEWNENGDLKLCPINLKANGSPIWLYGKRVEERVQGTTKKNIWWLCCQCEGSSCRTAPTFCQEEIRKTEKAPFQGSRWTVQVS